MIDYQEFTSKNTPKIERDKLGIGSIFSNTATCLLCGCTIRSRNRHDFRTCSCGKLSVDGGSWYIKRSFETINSFRNNVVLYDDV